MNVMALVLRTVSDFKRFLAKPGATIQIVQNTFLERQPAGFRDAYRKKGMYEPRTVQALSKKAAVFSVKGHPTLIWLYWDKGTRKWRFSGDTVTVPLDTGVGPPDAIVYRCSYGHEPEHEPEARVPVRRAHRKPASRPDPGRPAPATPPESQGRLL